MATGTGMYKKYLNILEILEITFYTGNCTGKSLLFDFQVHCWNFIQPCALTLIWVGFLGVRFEVGGGDKITPPPCLKLVTIMLETSNLARKYTPICGFRKYTFLVPRPP